MATEKLFIATANNSREFLQQINAEVHEIRDIALSNAHLQNRIVVIDQTSINYGLIWDVLNTLTGQATTMLHYIGHSSAKGLLLEGPSLQQTQLSPEALAGSISQPNRLRFVFLNSCYSQEIAIALRDAGVPYVIGTTKRVQDRQAVEVAKKFYSLLGNYSITIEEAFRQTQLHFDNDPTIPNPIPEPKRGGFSTEVDDSSGPPWQLYSRDDLTDTQRNWRLIPLPEQYVITPTETNERFIITESLGSDEPVARFFLSYTLTDQVLAKELVRQIRIAFAGYETKTAWSDGKIADPAERGNQIVDNLAQSDFIFLFTNTDSLSNPIAERVSSLAQERWQQRLMVAPPILFLTDGCDWQSSLTGQFSPILVADEPVSTTAMKVFANDLYEQWKKMQRQKRLFS